MYSNLTTCRYCIKYNSEMKTKSLQPMFASARYLQGSEHEKLCEWKALLLQHFVHRTLVGLMVRGPSVAYCSAGAAQRSRRRSALAGAALSPPPAQPEGPLLYQTHLRCLWISLYQILPYIITIHQGSYRFINCNNVLKFFGQTLEIVYQLLLPQLLRCIVVQFCKKFLEGRCSLYFWFNVNLVCLTD